MPTDIRHPEVFSRRRRPMVMSLDDMVAVCRRLAPDFTLSEEQSRHGHVVTGRCTVNGQRHELSLVVGEPFSREQTYLHIAESAMRSLANRMEPHADRPSPPRHLR